MNRKLDSTRLTDQHKKVLRELWEEPFSPMALADRVGLPEDRVIALLEDLRAWGFVELLYLGDEDVPVRGLHRHEEARRKMRRHVRAMIDQFGLACPSTGEPTDTVSDHYGLTLTLDGEWIYVLLDTACYGRASSLAPHEVWMLVEECECGRLWKRLWCPDVDSVTDAVVTALVCAVEIADEDTYDAFCESGSPEKWEAFMQAEDSTDA